MTYAIQPGIQISLDNTTWYGLTDHNRSQIEIKPELIEKSSRMANGMMRKYVVAKKDTISTSWSNIPSQSVRTVDYNATTHRGLSSAWFEAFYSANVGVPVYVKVVSAIETVPGFFTIPTEAVSVPLTTSLTTSKTYHAFISKFSKTIKHRNALGDFVDMEIEFTEI